MPDNPHYLIYVADAPHAKTAFGVRYWRPEWCVAQYRYPSSNLDLDLPDMGFAEAHDNGARTLLIGCAPAGGRLPPSWVSDLEKAMESGLNIASGLHERLSDHPVLRACADRTGRRIDDFRYQQSEYQIGSFERRSGKRLLTVGADCAVGKKYTALAIERELSKRGVKADFRATGQTGVLIAGGGIVIDRVVADFISAAAASLSPDAPAEHWDVIEGQGSLFHPAYAGVTLGLLHGSQPDAMVLCADPSRERLGDFERFSQPKLEDCITRYTEAARLTNPDAVVVGVSLNTSVLSEREAHQVVRETGRRLNLPCVDPIRNGVGPLVDTLL